MGLVLDRDSAEDMLFDLNRDNTNRSIYAKQFGVNSLNQQIAQSSVDEVYSEQLMNTYQTYLQQQNQGNTSGMIDSLREEVNQYNYDSLSKAYEASMNEHRSNSYDIYTKYWESQGKLGEELSSLAEAYGKQADSYLDYMKQAQLDATIQDYLIKTGIITESGDEGNVFADDSVIRNKMFATETTYDDQGNVLTNKGELTNEGRAILNMLQSNYSKADADEQSELSYNAWIENQEAYKDDRVDRATLRSMLGIESEYGKQYSKRDMMEISADYRLAVANAESAKLDSVKLENNVAYQSILSDNDVRITSDDIASIENDYNKTIDSIKSSLLEYGYTVEEFNEFLKSEGLDYTLDDAENNSLENMKKYIVTESDENTEKGYWISYDVLMGEGIIASGLAAYHTGAAVAAYTAGAATAWFTFGLGAAAGAAAGTYHTTMAIAYAATATIAFIAADSAKEDAIAYGEQLDKKVRNMKPYAKNMGVYYSTIKEKFNKFMKEGK